MKKVALNKWVKKEPNIKWYSVIVFNLIVLIMMGIGNAASGLIPVLAITFSLSAIPVAMAHSNIKNKLKLGYGIPAIALLPVPLFVWDAMTCTGKFCGLGSALMAYALGFGSILFATFFTLGYYLRILQKGQAIALSIIIPPLLIAIPYLLMSIH